MNEKKTNQFPNGKPGFGDKTSGTQRNGVLPDAKYETGNPDVLRVREKQPVSGCDVSAEGVKSFEKLTGLKL